jgi:hypothetical protein
MIIPAAALLVPQTRAKPIGLAEETGKFFISRWGPTLALGFRGEPDFIFRISNWANNTGVSKGATHWLYGMRNQFGYVTVKDRAAILRGLAAQFRAEIIMSKEIPPLIDRWDDETESPVIEYDEARIDALANARANQFMDTRITKDNFLQTNNVGLAPVYSLADEQWSGFQRNRRTAR